MHNVVLSLGSNIGNRLDYLNFGLAAINEKIGEIISVSSVYETEPIGFHADNNFFNICVLIETTLNPFIILEALQKIEKEAGRTKKSTYDNYDSRTLDIDIIVIDNLHLKTDCLTIPHPQFSKRKFVLIPMHEICPNFIIANSDKTVNHYLQKCEDETEIIRLELKLNYLF